METTQGKCAPTLRATVAGLFKACRECTVLIDAQQQGQYVTPERWEAGAKAAHHALQNMAAHPWPETESVRFVWGYDECTDPSYLGEYSSTPGPCAFDRQARGDMGRNEFRYWNPGPNHLPHKPASWAHVAPADLAAVVEKHGSIEAADEAYAEQDYKRHEAAGRGEWCMLHVRAEATIRWPSRAHGGETYRLQPVSSGGVGGIESDCGDSYKPEVEQQELADLKAELAAFGIDLPDSVKPMRVGP